MGWQAGRWRVAGRGEPGSRARGFQQQPPHLEGSPLPRSPSRRSRRRWSRKARRPRSPRRTRQPAAAPPCTARWPQPAAPCTPTSAPRRLSRQQAPRQLNPGGLHQREKAARRKAAGVPCDGAGGCPQRKRGHHQACCEGGGGDLAVQDLDHGGRSGVGGDDARRTASDDSGGFPTGGTGGGRDAPPLHAALQAQLGRLGAPARGEQGPPSGCGACPRRAAGWQAHPGTASTPSGRWPRAVSRFPALSRPG